MKKSMIKNLISIILIGIVLTCKLSGQENIALIAESLSTSHVSPWEDLYAINDGFEPASSMDHSNGCYGNWQSGVTYQWNWVQYDFDQYYIIKQSDVYWWTDQTDINSGIGVQIPYDCYIEYWDFLAEQWTEVGNPQGYGVEKDKYNVTTFDSVLTDKIRLHFVSISAQGIIEWKVFGVPGEQVPSKSTITIDKPLAKDSASIVTITAIDKNDSSVEGYVFKLNAVINNELGITNESYNINGQSYTDDATSLELTPTNAEGIVSFEISIPPEIDPTDGLNVDILFNDGFTNIKSYSIFEPGLTSPQLTADTTSNNVDNDLEITFADDPDWRSAVSAIKVDDAVLNEPVDYELTEGLLVIFPSGGNQAIVLAGSKNIVIEASGYSDTELTQLILAGAIETNNSTAQSMLKLFKGTTTSITAAAKDQYGNPITGYVFKWDAEVINTTADTNETYVIDGKEVTSNLYDQTLPETNTEGKVNFSVTVPSVVDLNDGVNIQVQLADGVTNIDSLIGYISFEGEKEVYIARDLKNHDDWSWDKTAQSDNFVIFWGDLTGLDPLNPDNGNADIAFDPIKILEKLEGFFAFYLDTLNFIPDIDDGNLAKYKFIVVMCNTWANNGYDGWATGGSWDGVIGAMWIHPGATGGSGSTLAHEFAHMCQAMIPIQYPGYGLKDNSGQAYVGMFWESHANFMSLTAVGEIRSVQPERWVNTAMMHYSSTRHYYQAIYFPQYLTDKFGMEEVNLIWRNAVQGDHPLESFKKNRGYTQEELNDEFGYNAMKNVTWDYSNGELIRDYLDNQVDPANVCREFTILDTIQGKPGTYIIPKYLAPGDYGYNIIPLYLSEDSSTVTIKFSGYDNEPSGGAGWRYGFIAVDESGYPRYSELYSGQNSEVSFTVNPGEDELYFVVSGAPKTHHNYLKWEPGYPKIYRYPYNLQFTGALPAGYLPGYNSQKDIYPGAPHSNGGGWVASTAVVDASVYVGPHAQVLGRATVSGNARIEDYAIVKDNAEVSGSAIIRDHSIVGKDARVRENAIIAKSARVYNGCNVYDNAVITGSAIAYQSSVRGNAVVKDVAIIYGASLSGDIIVGGDAEDFGTCSSGTYLQLFNISGRSGCDRLHDHILNVDVNPEISDYPADTLVHIASAVTESYSKNENYIIYYRKIDNKIVVERGPETENIEFIKVVGIDGRTILFSKNFNDYEFEINVPVKGIVIVMIGTKGSIYSEKVLVY